VKQLPVAALAAAAFSALGTGCFLFHSSDHAGCPHDKIADLGLQEDVQHVAGCTHVGGVRIRTGATLDVTPLHELEEISGDLAVGPTVGVDTVAFNGLLRVSGTIRIVSNGSLRGVFLPRLEHAGRIEIDGNVVLSTISMPRLVDVVGSLVVTDNAGLELLSAGNLQSIGGELVLVDHPKLNLLELSRLEHMQTIRIENDPKVPSDVVDELRNKAAIAEGP
jgi:hypothetical protein